MKLMPPPLVPTPAPLLTLIAAVTPSGGIGKANALLWHDPLDQAHFRETTMGCPVIMGRRTWDSLPPRFRPLPGRRNIVVTRDAGWKADGALAAHSLQDALAAASGADEVFVIGGAEIYALALPLADELVLTELGADFEADAFFPAWNRDEFERVDARPHVSQTGVPFVFATYRRLKRVERAPGGAG